MFISIYCPRPEVAYIVGYDNDCGEKTWTKKQAHVAFRWVYPVKFIRNEGYSRYWYTDSHGNDIFDVANVLRQKQNLSVFVEKEERCRRKDLLRRHKRSIVSTV